MVESKLVELVVAGSNPVGHPIFILFANPAVPVRWAHLDTAPVAPKGQHMNSRGRKPTEQAEKVFDPAGVALFPPLHRGLSPTAIHVWPLCGQNSGSVKMRPCQIAAHFIS